MITDHAYAAGLLDGEGSVLLNKSGAWRHPAVSMSSTTYELVAFMKRLYGGTICEKKEREGCKQAWQWDVEYDSAIMALAAMFQFMREPAKLYRAKLIIAEYKVVTRRNGRYNEEERKAKLDFELRFYRGVDGFDTE